MSRPITPGKQTSFASATDALAASTAGVNVRAKVAEKPVTEEELMTFLFPPDQQYPASASRLFLFGRYGPLVHGQIVGGSFKRHRGLTKQELGDLITQDEREELLALFLDPSVQKSLTPAEQAQVLGETIAIPHVQHALFNYSTKMLYGVFVPNGPGGLNLEPEAWKSHEGAKRVSSRNRSDVGSPYPAQIRFNILKKCEPLHYKVWGHIPTPKPGGYNQFELHLDAEQASKLAALFLKGK